MKATSLQGKKYVIVGNSAAGLAAAREIRKYDSRGAITVISDERTFAYSRVMLPLYISGKVPRKDMFLGTKDFYASLNIRLLRGETVVSMDPRGQRLLTRSGLSLPYDFLLLATGASPRSLKVPGKDLQGIHYLRKMTDAETIRRDLSSSRGPILFVGGGLVSLKTLDALGSKKKEFHLVISSEWILSQMLDQAASDFFLKTLRGKKVRIHLPTDVIAFRGRDKLEGVLLSDGTDIPCAMAIIGKGVQPNIGPARQTEIQINQGILVDQHMATNLPSVYAAGDVAESIDLLQKRNRGNALWPVAAEGGRIAGSNMASVSAIFPGAIRMNTVEVMGLRAVSAGDFEGEEEAVSFRGDGSVYRKLVFSGGRLRGFILVGDIRGAGTLTAFLKNEAEVSRRELEEGMERGFSYAPRLKALGGSIQPSMKSGGDLAN